MRRHALIFVCFLPLALLSAGAQASSPAAGKIVYSSDRGPNVRNAEIYSIRPDGSRRRNLSRNQGPDGGFAWAPNGNRIAFWAERSGVDGPYIRGLYVMRADGSGQERLTPSEMLVSLDSEPPTWSPDGRRLAFSAHREGVSGIWVVRADGRDLRLLAERGSRPVWAPRGSRIAFVGEGPAEAPIEVVDADDGSRLRVTDGHVDYSPTWSPDARALAFVRFDSMAFRYDVYRVAAGGGAPLHLAAGTDGAFVGEAAWSPGGATIAFSEGTRLGRTTIKTVGADGVGSRTLGLGTMPAWTPDGRRIAVATHSAVYVMKADGSARRKVRDERPAMITAGPAWSSDGKTLLFASTRESADHELFVVVADGSQRRQLTSNAVDDVLPAWSPAHRRIAFARETGSNDPSIWIMTASGANQHRLGLGTHPSWSPRGSRLAFERRGVVYTMTDRGRNVRQITAGERPAWAPRGASIAFLHDTELFVADADTGAVRRLADLRCQDEGLTSLSSPEWSPDASQIVVPVGCDYGRSSYVTAVLVDAGGGGRTGSLPINLALSRVAWSPDGDRVAFSVGEPWYGDSPRIDTTRLDGTAMTTVTSGSGDDRDPDW